MIHNIFFQIFVEAFAISCLVGFAYCFGKGKPNNEIKDGYYVILGGHKKYHSFSGGRQFLVFLKNARSKEKDPLYINTKKYKLLGFFDFSPGDRVIVANKNKTIKLATKEDLLELLRGKPLP